MKIHVTQTLMKLGILILVFNTNISKSTAQTNDLYNVGEKLIEIAKSGNPDKVVDYIDDKLDLDKKAEIMESFLTVKDQLFASMEQDKIQLFNAINEKNNTYFIVYDGNKFIIVKTKINDNNKFIEHFAIVNNKTADLLKLGKKIYKTRCYSCHGKFAQGGIAPNLTDNYWIYVKSDQNLFELVQKGKKGTMMIAFKDYLNPKELKAVLTYIKAMHNKKQKKPKKPEGEEKKLDLSIF